MRVRRPRWCAPLIIVEDGRIVEKFFAIEAGEVVPVERPDDVGGVGRDSRRKGSSAD